MLNVNDIREHFVNALEAKEYVVDKTGQRTIEYIGACFLADEPAIFGEPNQEYIDAEIQWYETMSTNINTLEKIYGKSPAAWQYSANEVGEINSNYGTLIHSDKYFNQYGNVIDELLRNPDSRRAMMVYNRPSVWVDYCENGKNDFICTNAVSYYIRNGAINAVVQMRSNDVVFGYKNDYAWQKHVLSELTADYNSLYLDNAWDADYRREMVVGDIIWQVQNLHVYERHFDLVK